MEGYSGVRAKLYDARISGRDDEDMGFYVEEAEKSGSPILEVACGTGRVLIPVAEAGLEVVGLDSSSDMLALAKEKVLELATPIQDRIELVEGDMRGFSLGRTFRTILIP